MFLVMKKVTKGRVKKIVLSIGGLLLFILSYALITSGIDGLIVNGNPIAKIVIGVVLFIGGGLLGWTAFRDYFR